MNIWKHERKKCGKLRIRDIFLSPRAITPWKINGSKPNSNLICILLWQSNVPNIKWISESTKKKVRKTENLWYFSKSKGHNSVKNQWIKTKLELDLYLGMAKQYTKTQMNIWKHEEKKCGKLRICDIFLSPRAITPWKINGSKPNSNLICILVWQSNTPNIKWISESTKKKSAENWFFALTDGQTDRVQTYSPLRLRR